MFESIIYFGMMWDIVLLIFGRSELCLEFDYFVVYSFEWEDLGNLNFFVYFIFKVVGGVGIMSFELVSVLYVYVVVEMIFVFNCEVVEVCKIFENIYCSVNIVMVNEMKILF